MKRILAIVLALTFVAAFATGASAAPPPRVPDCSSVRTIANSGYIGYTYYNIRARTEELYTASTGASCSQWRPVIDIFPFATHTFAFVCERFTSNGSNSFDSACLNNVALTGQHTWSFAAPWWKPFADFHCQGPYAALAWADDFAGGNDHATSPYVCMP